MKQLFTTNKGMAFTVGLTFCCLILAATVSAKPDAAADTQFCTSCHEMEANVLPDYQKSMHFSNASGVRASCSSCHVPQEFVPKMIRKAKAAKEVVSSIQGTIDTPEKFDDHRLRMAKLVWEEMEANDSRECRSCHARDGFDFAKFKKEGGAKRMQKGLAEGQTCIGCHKGIVHKLPDMASGYKSIFKEMRAEAKENGVEGDVQYPLLIVPMFKEKDGRPVGKILPATKLVVEDEDGDWLKVTLSGWQQDGVDAMIYEEQGKRIFAAAMSKKMQPEVVRSNTMVDPDTEQTWHQAKLTCWVKAKDLVNDREPLWNYGNEMLSAACSTCHSTTPASHFKANQWIGNLKAMKHNISLSKEEYRFFLKYLQMHASDMGGSH